MSTPIKLKVTVEIITPENSAGKFSRPKAYDPQLEEDARMAVEEAKAKKTPLPPKDHKFVVDTINKWMNSVEFVPR